MSPTSESWLALSLDLTIEYSRKRPCASFGSISASVLAALGTLSPHEKAQAHVLEDEWPPPCRREWKHLIDPGACCRSLGEPHLRSVESGPDQNCPGSSLQIINLQNYEINKRN